MLKDFKLNILYIFIFNDVFTSNRSTQRKNHGESINRTFFVYIFVLNVVISNLILFYWIKNSMEFGQAKWLELQKTMSFYEPIFIIGHEI